MALPAITYTDFSGVFDLNIPQLNRADFTEVIAEQYKKFVRRYIGDPAYIEIKSQDPLKQKWVDLFGGVDYFNTEEQAMRTHDGLRRVAVGAIFFEYLRNNGVYNTPTGDVVNKNGNSTNLASAMRSSTVYNRVLLELMQEVYPFIENYELLRGNIDSSVDNGGGNYTLNVSDTTYLYDGDTVKINQVDYTVRNLVDDTSFDITASSAGLDFSGQPFSYEPYKDFPMPDVNAVVPW